MMQLYERTQARALRYLWRTVTTLGVASAIAACGDTASNPRTIAVPASIVVSASTQTLESLQQTVTMTAIVKDRAGNEIPSVPLVWTAENPDILESVSNGVFRSKANGSTEIKVDVDPSYPGVSKSGYSIGARGRVTIVVQQKPAGVRIFPSAKTLWALQQKGALATRIVDANGYIIESEDPPAVTWASDSTAIATVDNTGQVVAVQDGIAVITASAFGFTATAPVLVSASSPLSACFTASIRAAGVPTPTGRCVSLTMTVKDRQP